MKARYKVLWDNGHACDTLPDTFTNRRDAERAARDWKREMVAIDPDPAEARQAYSWEIVTEGEDD